MAEAYVVLLRGINVSGQKKIKMADLRDWLESAGLQAVQTYIQSGNIVVQYDGTSAELSDKVHGVLANNTGWDIPVCVRTASEWRSVFTNNPFTEAAEVTPQFVGVVFFHKAPQSLPDNLDAPSHPAESYQALGNEVYLHLPNGFGRTKLTNNYWEKQAQTAATTRNWKTVCALENMLPND